MMKVLHKIMPLGFNGTSTNVWTTIAIPPCTSNTSNQFFVQCKIHIHYIWILLMLFMNKKSSNFLQIVYIFKYIHFQCQWIISMEVKLVYKNVAWKIHGCHMRGTKCVLVQKWNVKLIVFTLILIRIFTNRFQWKSICTLIVCNYILCKLNILSSV